MRSCLLRVELEQFLGGTGLHGDDGDAVRNDIMQLARDPGPLLTDGGARHLA